VIFFYRNNQLKSPVCLKRFHECQEVVRGMPAHNLREVSEDGLSGNLLYFVF